jgi:hypothetical protein
MRKCLHSFALCTLGILLLLFACAPEQGVIEGRVVDEEGTPLPGAVVRVKASALETVSDDEGFFSLTSLPRGETYFITAWVKGYYINGIGDLETGASDVEIVLHAHPEGDNPDYAWLPSTVHPGEGEDQGCAECHSVANSPPPLEEGEGVSVSLPVDEWLLDAHSQAALNPRFLTMYAGTDVEGNQSPLTRYGSSRDYGSFPLRPDPSLPYYGPGYKLDFLDTVGNCAACHTPLAAVDDAYGVDPTHLSGVETEGISCDFCHKVWDVRLDPDSGLPFPNMPGVLSLEFRRPPEGHQFFAGPLDDVAPGEDTYSPVQRESRFCAACHFGIFWDTVIYNSFGEWLESPYSDPATGQTCQDCHMPSSGATHFARPDQGGVTRDPDTIFSHRMPGATDVTLLQNAVTMNVSARREEDQIVVNVTLLNDQTGHHVPTDSPLRQMILLVRAKGPDGELLEFTGGPVVPEWGGIGDAADGYYAGLPGKGYAKILMELWTEISPSGAYWNPTRVVSDNRIPAFGSDESTYFFSAPAPGAVGIEVTLLYRRAFVELMDQKGWDDPDIVMEHVLVVDD